MRWLYSILEVVSRYLWVNLLWVLFNLPVWYFLMMLLFVQDQRQLLGMLVILGILIPLLFIPATTSVFAIVREWKVKEQVSPIMISFWRYYKENYIKSMLSGFLMVIVWGILWVDYFYFKSYFSGSFIYLFLLLFVLLLTYSLYIVSSIVHFEGSFVRTIKNAWLVMMVNPIASMGIGIMSAIIIYVSFYHMSFLIPTFLCTLLAYLTFTAFHKVYLTVKIVGE